MKLSHIFHKAKSTFSKAKDWAKRTKNISKILGLVKHLDPKLAAAHALSVKHGYGRRRRRRITGGSRRGTNTSTFLNRNIAMSTYPSSIPKLSIELRQRNNALGLAGNYK